MNLLFSFVVFFLISIIECDNVTNNTTVASNKTVNNTVSETQGNAINSSVNKLEMLSEGGIIAPKLSPVTLPTENHPNIITLDNEIGKSKSKSIVPRKGVVYPGENNGTTLVNPIKDSIDTTLAKTQHIEKKLNETKNVPSNSSVLHLSIPTKILQGAVLNETLASNPKPKPKKPLVLSYEALSENGPKAPSGSVLLPKEPSSNPIVADQIQAPIKIHPMNANRHPGLIMPIVITILVVPIFAILGYLAVRRGKEAWKNRHYKRVDFLLDGMYND